MNFYCYFTYVILITTLTLAQAKIIDIGGIKIDTRKIKIPNLYLRDSNEAIMSNDNVGRIINGSPASPKQLPYQAGLFLTGGSLNAMDNFCGGSLVSPTTVLTAAHCLYGIKAVIVCLGCIQVDRTVQQNGKQVFLITDPNYLKVHEKYNPNSNRNDIAIIKLPRPAMMTEYVKTIDLAQSYSYYRYGVDRNEYEGRIGMASGWGKENDSEEKLATNLMYNILKVSRFQDCQEYYRSFCNYKLDNNQMCTEATNGGGTCQGDSGGPLAYTNSYSRKPILIGVTSFGTERCEVGSPSIYTRVAPYYSWIKSQF